MSLFSKEDADDLLDGENRLPLPSKPSLQPPDVSVFTGSPDYVIDAIDNIDTKVRLVSLSALQNPHLINLALRST